jgi:K+-sensing histidine kinase KdpD
MFKRTVAVITLGTFLAGCAGQTLSSNQRGGLVFATVGLGLAAVQGIVQGHKGTMKVYSRPGKGTTFNLDYAQHLTGRYPAEA